MIKKMLFITGALLMTRAASATDITSPFYLPYKGQLGLITTAGANRLVTKNRLLYSKSNQLLLKEEAQYGLTDSLTFTASIGNTWDKWKANWKNNGRQTTKDNENIAWNTGLAWNVLQGPTHLQLAAQYGQDRLKNFNGEYKALTTEAKLGYRFQRVLPYITGGIEIPVGQKSGHKGIAGNKLIYNTKAGIYQGSCEVWSLDTGVRLTYDENTEGRTIAAEAEASYYLTSSIAASLWASYVLDGGTKLGTLYEKALGLRLRLFF